MAGLQDDLERTGLQDGRRVLICRMRNSIQQGWRGLVFRMGGEEKSKGLVERTGQQHGWLGLFYRMGGEHWSTGLESTGLQDWRGHVYSTG